MSDYIPLPTLKQLLKELKDLSTDWFLFGVFLDVPVSKLRAIESMNSKDVERCKLETLDYWLKRKIDTSWKKIVQALEQLDECVLAAEVKQKYLWPSTGGERKGTTDEFQTEIRADVAVVEGLRELENSFYGMIVEVKECLEELECDLSVAQLFLDGVTGTENFNSCVNFYELMELLQRDYIDIFNTSILQRLIACFKKKIKKDGLPTKLVQDYEKEKEEFLKQTKVRSFQRAVVSRVEPVIPKVRAVVTIKIADETTYNRTLKDIEKLARKGFEDCYKFLVHLHAKVGSIIISWIFPETLSGKLKQLAYKNADIFEEAGVEEVTVGGRRVYPVTEQEDLLTPSQGTIPSQGITLEEKSAVKQVYAEFYYQLVEAVSDPLTCQSFTAQLHSTTLIPQEKIAQLSSGGVTGSDFFKVLGVEKEPHLLAVLMEKIAGVKQLQKLAERMSARLSEVKQQVGEAEKRMTVSDKQASGQLTTADVIHAYDVSLRASKEKEQQLQSQLATVQQESLDKEQQLSKLEIENDNMLKKMHVFEYETEQHLKKLQKDYEARLAASNKEQQRLLKGMEQRQKMSRAKDTEISRLLNENEIMQKKCEASYQQSQEQLQAAADKIALLEKHLTVRKVSTSPLSDQHQKGLFVGETVPEDTEMNFTYLLFYKPILGTTLKVDFIFVVTYNNELFLENIRKEYCSYLEDRQYRMLKFYNDTIVLDLPAEGYLADGWKLLPLNHPQIARVDVQQFCLGRKVPACTIELEWIGSGEPRRLSHKVNIIGAKKPDNYFYMRYFPQNYTSTDSSSKKETTPTLPKLKRMQGKDGTPLSFIKRVAAGDYMTFGMCLLHDENGDEVEMLEKYYRHQGAEALTEAIIQKWLTSGGATWQHLIECLRQSGMGALAKLIAKNYVQQ